MSAAAVVKGAELQEQLEKSTVIYFQYKVNFQLWFLWNHLIGCQTEAAAQATPSGPATVSSNQPSADGCQSNGLKRCLMWGNMTATAALAHLSDQSAAAHPADMWQRLAPPDLPSPSCLICVWVWPSEIGNRQEVTKQDGVLLPQLWNKKVTDEAKVFLRVSHHGAETGSCIILPASVTSINGRKGRTAEKNNNVKKAKDR